tara:strand:- start:379 stop:744 length:366 start_codon:yes stop_codon:yes gene_type:complete
MKDGISFFPKKYLVALLSGNVDALANILSIIMEDGNDPEACVSRIDDLLGSNTFLVQYATSVKAVMQLIEDKKEIKAMEAEAKLHLDVYKKKYDSASKEFADMQLVDLFNLLGLEGQLNND